MEKSTKIILFILGALALTTGSYMAYKYFIESEFDSPATPQDELNRAQVYKKDGRYYLLDSGKNNMKAKFLQKLDKAREQANLPFEVSSGYRSKQWEKFRGRSGNSAHTLGIAADVKFKNTADRDRMIKAAIAAGITRIGIAPTYLHFDIADSIDPVKYAQKYWGYDSNGNASTAAAPFDPFKKFA